MPKLFLNILWGAQPKIFIWTYSTIRSSFLNFFRQLLVVINQAYYQEWLIFLDMLTYSMSTRIWQVFTTINLSFSSRHTVWISDQWSPAHWFLKCGPAPRTVRTFEVCGTTAHRTFSALWKKWKKPWYNILKQTLRKHKNSVRFVEFWWIIMVSKKKL